MAGAGYELPRSRRLLKPSDFKATRGSPCWRNELFRVYAIPNPYAYARLGIVVSRRVSPRAVVRNRIKRYIRETFRCRQPGLCGLDIVVTANPPAGMAKIERLRQTLGQMWESVEEQCSKS